jgi:hypothetical protein
MGNSCVANQLVAFQGSLDPMELVPTFNFKSMFVFSLPGKECTWDIIRDKFCSTSVSFVPPPSLIHNDISHSYEYFICSLGFTFISPQIV